MLNEQQQPDKMQKRFPLMATLLLLCVGSVLLCACKEQEQAVQPEMTAVSYIDQPLPDLTLLAEQKELLEIDLRGHDVDAAQIAALREALPSCRVLWDIEIADTRIDGDAASICLSNLKEEDLGILSRFENLKMLDARGSDCAQALSLFEAEHPELEVLWSVEIADVQVSNIDQWLDLSLQILPQTSELMACLDLMPQLTDVSLVGCILSLTDKAMLQALYPDIRFFWTVEIDGKEYKNTETRLDLNYANINNTEDLALLLNCFRHLEKVDVSTLGFATVDMEELCRQFPETVFAWTLMVGRHMVRTDATVFNVKATKTARLLRDEDLEPLKYCTELRAINLSGQAITDLSALAGLSKLEVLVISENDIKDLRPLSGLGNLHYLEAYGNKITDVSPLASLPELYDLNLMRNDITDVSPLATLTSLQRGYFSRNELSDLGTQRQLLSTALPNALLDFNDSNQGGWRNHDRYDKLSLVWETNRMLEMYP